MKSYKNLLFSLAVIMAFVLALLFPEPFKKVGDFELKLLIVPLLQIIMFGMGSQMSLKDFHGVIRSPKAVFVGVICQFTIMPLVALLLTAVFAFPAEIAAGVILVGSSPSGLASNVMCFLARANLALSVTLTAVATLMAPLMTPFLMKLLAGQYVPIDFWKMMIGIMDIVILPIIAGLIFNALAFRKVPMKAFRIQLLFFALIVAGKNFLQVYQGAGRISTMLINDAVWFLVLPAIIGALFYRFSNGNRAVLDKGLSLLSMIGIAVIIVIISAAGRENLLQVGFALVVICMLHNLLGYFAGYRLCRLLKMDEKSCRTIALEVGMQNSGLASGIALQMGKLATVGLAASIFGPLMNITGSVLANWWHDRPS